MWQTSLESRAHSKGHQSDSLKCLQMFQTPQQWKHGKQIQQNVKKVNIGVKQTNKQKSMGKSYVARVSAAII